MANMRSPSIQPVGLTRSLQGRLSGDRAVPVEGPVTHRRPAGKGILEVDGTELALFPSQAAWQAQLSAMGYTSSQIEVRQDLLAVYWDSARRIPLLLIQTPMGGAASDAMPRILRDKFPFLVSGSPEFPSVLKVDVTHGGSEPVATIPTWMAAHPRTGLVPKSTLLLPFQS